MNPAKRPSTIALFASARRNGNTGKLMDRIVNDLQVELIDLAVLAIAPYDYKHNNRNDDFEPLMQHVLSFDQIILASPVYWYGVSAPMKTFLDRTCDYLDLPDLREQGRKLRGKRGFVVCTSVYDEVALPFISSLQQTFEYLGMKYGGFIHANCHAGYTETSFETDIGKFVALVRRGDGLHAPL